MRPTLSHVVFFWTLIIYFSSLVPLLGVFPLFIYLFASPLCLCTKENPIMPCDLNIKNHGIGKLKTIREISHVFSVAIDNMHPWFKIKFIFKL